MFEGESIEDAIKRLDCFDQIVKRLTPGHSVVSTARWAQRLNLPGQAGKWSFLYWRNLLHALAPTVRKVREQQKRLPPSPVVPTVVQMVVRKIEEETGEMIMNEMPDPAKSVWKSVKKATKELNAETMLKYLFLRQQKRVEAMMALEEKLNLRFPDGYKDINALRAIAEAVGKLEQGDQLIRGKGQAPWVIAEENQQQPLSDIAQVMSQFDEVDRNLMRRAGLLYIDMVQEGGLDAFKANRRGAVEGRIAGEDGGVGEGAGGEN